MLKIGYLISSLVASGITFGGIFGLSKAGIIDLNNNDWKDSYYYLMEEIESDNENVSIRDLENDINIVYEKVKKGVVGIKSDYGSGSGYIYRKDNKKYYIVTNEHVVKDDNNVSIYLGGNTLHTNGIVLGKDAYTDIAIIEFDISLRNNISEDDLYVNKFASTSSTNVGEFVIAIGSPLGFSNYNSLTFGVVSGKRVFDPNNDNDKNPDNNKINYIQHDASINSGNSGGPLYNIDGEIIGTNVLKFSSTNNDSSIIEGMGFAIDLYSTLNAINDIDAGFGISTFTNYNLKTENIPNDNNLPFNGAYVTNGKMKDINKYDTLLEINDLMILNNEMYINILNTLSNGDIIVLTYYDNDNNSIKDILITL